jgi:hypothetical protein
VTHEEMVAFADREKIVIEQIANERGISFDEAVNQLFSEGLENRMRKKTHRNPSANVRNFRRG